MSRFQRVAVLDRVLLTDDQHARLGRLADAVVEFSRVDPEELLRRVSVEMDSSSAPMCWTQLAHEEVTNQELNRRLAGADAVITCWTVIPDDVLRANPQIRCIGFWTNLAAHRINVELAREMGIQLTYLPDYGTESVAEITIAGILAVSRGLLGHHRDTGRGRWPYELLKTGKAAPRVEDIPDRLLAGRSIGIVGFGRIGQRVAELALAFRMNVRYHSRNRYSTWESKGVEFLPLDELVQSCDVVSVHLSPYAPERIISRELLESMKPGALFVNTSAGRLVDQEALLELVEAGRLQVYMDVYEGLPPRRRLNTINLNRNIFTYRAGWYTREAITQKGEMLIQNLEAFLSGRGGTTVDGPSILVEHEFDVPCRQTRGLD